MTKSYFGIILAAVNKFLFVRFSSIGDIVLTTAVIRCLKLQKPEAEIFFLTKSRFKPLLENNPYLKKVIGIESSINDAVKEIKEINPDCIIDLHANLRSRLLALKIRKKTFSIPKLNFLRWKMVYTRKREALPHINSRYFKALEKFGITYDGLGLDYFLGELERKNKDLAQLDLSADFDVWIIGATHFTKRLPAEKIIEGINIRQRPAVLIGGSDEHTAGSGIAAACNFPVINLCGKTNFDETALVIQKAKIVFTNDTGFMHVAAALKKKIVSFWGGTVPELGMSPLLPKISTPAMIVENNQISCRPCSKIGKAACPLGHFSCMKEINMQTVRDC